MKTRTAIVHYPTNPLKPKTSDMVIAPYFEPAFGEQVRDFARHLGEVLKEQEARIERFEYYLADIYDRFRKLGVLPPEDTAQLGRINELMLELEKRAAENG